MDVKVTRHSWSGTAMFFVLIHTSEYVKSRRDIGLSKKGTMGEDVSVTP